MQSRLFHSADKRCDDHLRDFVLHRKYVVEFTVVAFGPQVDAGRRFDQLCGDPDAASGPTDTALQNVGYTELAPDLGEVN